MRKLTLISMIAAYNYAITEELRGKERHVYGWADVIIFDSSFSFGPLGNSFV
jgi:hypothetical protein